VSDILPSVELCAPGTIDARKQTLEGVMNGLIYIVGLVVVVLAVLSFFGLR
jgi:small-conductance mechanosensitive channel